MAIALKSFDDVNGVLLNIAALQLNAEKKENSMNEMILDIKKKFEPEIKQLQDAIEPFEKQLIEFSKANKKAFKDKRSTSLTYGTVGFRSGKKALRLLNAKKFTWEYIKEKLELLYGTKYVKVKTTIKKTEIVNDVEKGLITEATLSEVLKAKVSQSDEFYYKINWDEIKQVELK